MRLANDGELTGAGRAVVLVLTLWALVVVVPDTVRVAVPYWTLGITADQDGRIADVDRGVRADAPIAAGDRIDLAAMSCAHGLTACADLMAIVGGMGGLQYVTPGHAPVVLVVRRAGRGPPRKIAIVPQPPDPPPLWARVALAADELLAMFFIAVGAVLVCASPSVMTAGFFLYALWFNPGQYFVWYAVLQPSPGAVLAQEIAQSVLQAAGYAGLVVFAIRFPENAPDPRWRRWEYPLALAAGCATLVLQLGSFANAFGVGTRTVTNAAYLAGYAVAAAVTVVLFLRLAGLPPEARQRLRWVAWGCAIGLTAFIFADSNEATTMWAPLWARLRVGAPSEGILDAIFALNAAVAIVVWYAVRHHRVVNVTFALSRSMTLLITWILAGGVLAGVSLALEPHLEAQLQRPVFVVAVVAVTLTFEWLHERINDGCDRAFFPSLHRAALQLGTAGARMAEAAAFEDVDGPVVEQAVVAFGLTSAAIFRAEDGTFVRRGAFCWHDGTSALAPACAIALHADRRGRPFRLHELGACDEQFPAGDAYPAVVVPIRAHGELTALAFYGPHHTGEDLNGEEMALLATFADRAARGYDRAEITALRDRIAKLIGDGRSAETAAAAGAG